MTMVNSGLKGLKATGSLLADIIYKSTCHCKLLNLNVTRETRGIHPMLIQCWASVEDSEPTLYQLWENVSCCWADSDVNKVGPRTEELKDGL